MILPGWPPTRNEGRCCVARSSEVLEERDGGASIRIARFRPRPDWAGLDLVAIAEREGKTAAGNRPGDPAERRRAGDQLRHE